MNVDNIASENSYLTSITKIIDKEYSQLSKKKKIPGKLTYIPKINEYEMLLKYNYNLTQLRQIAKIYFIKNVGKKQELLLKIYLHLYLSHLVVKVQKTYRKYLQNKCVLIRGPAINNKLLCTNCTDFLSMDELTNIPNNQFFSYKDKDGFIYGFDILSFYNLLKNGNGIIKNPYNQQDISNNVINKFKELIHLCKILNINVNTKISDITKEVSCKKSVEFRTLTLFQNMDALGNYTDPKWFLKLNKEQLIKFIRELVDIWQYRSQISIEIKRLICNPSGNPFQRLPKFSYIQTLENNDDIRKIVLEIMEKFVTTGVDKDNKCLGTYFVLCALTLVNSDAATSLPWLYEAAYHM
jgi:hypothetical protein